MGVLDTFKGLRDRETQREVEFQRLWGIFFGLGLIEVGGGVCGRDIHRGLIERDDSGSFLGSV